MCTKLLIPQQYSPTKIDPKTQKGGVPFKNDKEELQNYKEENVYVWCIKEELFCLRNKQTVCIGRKKLQVLVM